MQIVDTAPNLEDHNSTTSICKKEMKEENKEIIDIFTLECYCRQLLSEIYVSESIPQLHSYECDINLFVDFFKHIPNSCEFCK